MNGIQLEKHVVELFCKLVEVQRSGECRHEFTFRHKPGKRSVVCHPGFRGSDGVLECYRGDVEALVETELASKRPMQNAPDGFFFDITQRGYAYYSQVKSGLGTPVQRVHAEVRSYLDGRGFMDRNKLAYDKWADAERLLWIQNPEERLTDVGHRLREAVQAMTDGIITKYGVVTEARPEQTVDRLRAIIEQVDCGKDKKTEASLEALVHFWGTMSDCLQRLEHGLFKNNETLTWEQGRHAVFLTAVVLFEVDRMLEQAKQPERQ